MRVGAAFGTYLSGGAISLGRDTRTSGPSLERAFLEGVLRTGVDVHSYGVIPIPILGYITMKMGRRAAAYISASHNPPEYNGIRFRTGDGYGMLYRDAGIVDIYMSGEFRSGNGSVTVENADRAILEYGDYAAEKVKTTRDLRVVLDTGNGSACGIAPIYTRAGIEVELLNATMDGRFPGRGAAPTSESLREAAERVVSTGADFGVGFDPDADRGMVIDDKGRVLPPEKIAIIIARRRYKPGDLVIAGFDCSMILERELERDGIRVERERVGDVFVANRVKESGAVLGVERSGHFFIPEFQYSDDPFAMSLALAEIVSEEKLSEMADEIPDYPYLQRSIRLKENIDIQSLMDKLLEELADLEPDTTDGIKVMSEGWSVLIRPSNTEPLIRIYVESVKDDVEKIAGIYENKILSTMRSGN
ncbi:phosphomannomutase [Methanothrix thermoacetophila PT]|uniref:Phosphomannomutase n=2 Tax=Methanotrichaceae TaxID=143067 RepID=A0B8L3_METTP|nr:phosphomannomutase [Methanothrix thermoacetophila PT]